MAKFSQIFKTFFGLDTETSLNGLLEQADPSQDLTQRLLWIERWWRWQLAGGPGSAPVRARYFLLAMQRKPEWRLRVGQLIVSVFREADMVPFFAHIGLSTESSLLSDLVDRTLTRLLPLLSLTDIAALAQQVFSEDKDIESLAAMPESFFGEIRQMVLDTDGAPEALARVAAGVRDAQVLLAATIAHHGVAREILSRMELPAQGVASLPHLSLVNHVQTAPQEKVDEAINACREYQLQVYRHVEQRGVSVGLVHRLEILGAALDQLQILGRLRELGTVLSPDFELRSCLLHFARATVRGRSLRSHLRHQIYFLSRKIVERNGQSGDHVVGRSRAELRRLYLRSLGSGVIVVFMTLAKANLSRLALAPLVAGTAAFVIYAAGFLLMQFTGSVLATKLPSFTASHLATLLRSARGEERIRAVWSDFRWILRSQAVALAGNVTALIPTAIAVSYLCQTLGRAPMPQLYAEHVPEDLHLWRSSALVLGALTGVELWLSSLSGGWFENFVVFRRVPESLAKDVRIRRVFGETRARWFAQKVLRHSSAFAGNLVLAFLFGFVPVIGHLLGANLDGKHVTISSSAAVVSAMALGPASWSASVWWPVAAALVFIGLFNVLVSFGLALWVALRAQNVHPQRLRTLWGARR